MAYIKTDEENEFAVDEKEQPKPKVDEKKQVNIDNTYENLKQSLELYIADRKQSGDEETVYTAHTFLEWIKRQTEIIKDEKIFSISAEDNTEVKRGNVVWVDFGFNVADEFGGKHPAIIYRRSGTQVFVFPLTTQPPKGNKNVFVKVPYVHNFQKMNRWINVLNLKCVSIQRIDFNSKPFGNVNGKVLANISTTWQKQGIR